MRNYRKSYFSARTAILCICALVFMFFLPNPGSAEDTRSGSPDQEESRMIVRSCTMIVEVKSESSIWERERRYQVAENTEIQDERGEDITLKELPVPCEAQVEYQLIMDQDPLCLKIKVLRNYN